jgi:hypothetical protein
MRRIMQCSSSLRTATPSLARLESLLSLVLCHPFTEKQTSLRDRKAWKKYKLSLINRVYINSPFIYPEPLMLPSYKATTEESGDKPAFFLSFFSTHINIRSEHNGLLAAYGAYVYCVGDSCLLLFSSGDRNWTRNWAWGEMGWAFFFFAALTTHYAVSFSIFCF